VAAGTGSADPHAAALAVTRALVAGRGADVVLDELARQGRALGGAAAAGIIRISDQGRLWLATTVGMTEEYVECIRELLLHEATITASAVADGQPRVVVDIGTYAFYDAPAFAKARAATAKAGFCALLSIPLLADERCLGTLNLYRRDAYEWPEEEIERLKLVAEHSAALIICADREESQQRRVDALLSLSHALRQSSHEYANRLHVLSGTLAMGNARRARDFLDELVRVHHDDSTTVVHRIRPAAIAGLLLVQMRIAHARRGALDGP
jgi:GAF domain-containing protein